MGLQEIIRRAIEIGNRTGFITFDQIDELCREDRKPVAAGHRSAQHQLHFNRLEGNG